MANCRVGPAFCVLARVLRVIGLSLGGKLAPDTRRVDRPFDHLNCRLDVAVDIQPGPSLVVLGEDLIKRPGAGRPVAANRVCGAASEDLVAVRLALPSLAVRAVPLADCGQIEVGIALSVGDELAVVNSDLDPVILHALTPWL